MFSKIIEKLALAQRQMLHRLYIGPKKERDTLREFHKLYYYSNVAGKTWSNTWWMGTQVLKCPLDLWIYQEIIHKTKPDLIIETGTYKGGTAHFFASMCDIVGKGEVITIDIEEHPNRPIHPRISYLHGSSTSPEMIDIVKGRIKDKMSVLVILDSDHSMAHVRTELELYAPFITDGNYLIVEDTNINGNPVLPESGPGPHEAIADFLPSHSEFSVDRTMEKLLMTFNPGGYLVRTKIWGD